MKPTQMFYHCSWNQSCEWTEHLGVHKTDIYFFVKPQHLVTSWFQINLKCDTCGSVKILDLLC